MQFSRMSNKQVDALFAQLLSNCCAELKKERRQRAKERKIEADAERIRQLRAKNAFYHAVAEVKADYELREEVIREMMSTGVALHVAVKSTAIKRALIELAIKYEVI